MILYKNPVVGFQFLNDSEQFLNWSTLTMNRQPAIHRYSPVTGFWYEWIESGFFTGFYP